MEQDLDKLKAASSQSEVVELARQFGHSAAQLSAAAGKRQNELKVHITLRREIWV